MYICVRTPTYNFIYGLFDDVVSSSDYIASNDRMTYKQRIEKDLEEVVA
jgi:hypothetical protein